LTSNPTIFDHALKNNAACLALQLQDKGAAAFAASWNELLSVLASKRNAINEAIAR
jgi:hypothetical protein